MSGTYFQKICFFLGQLIPDGKVRVSTKTLAIGCLANAISMTPKVFLLTLFSDDEEEDTTTILIRDVANFSEHEDPQLRGKKNSICTYQNTESKIPVL